MKILINLPDLRFLGGVANHYSGLSQYWNENVSYNVVGRRAFCKSISGTFLLPYDIVKFVIKLLIIRPDVVLLNPSLLKRAIKRDFIFLRIAKFFNIKTALFIHGFNLDYANIVNKDWLVRRFNQADLIFILAEQFKDLLRTWGVNIPIALSTTKVANYLVDDFVIDNKEYTRNILFLARVEEAKGVYITINAYIILKQEFPDLTLTIAGNGTELQNVKNYIAKHNVTDVQILGSVAGDELINVFKTAGLYALPSSHGEGMPTSVLEAMAFGLPVFTTKVGGLPDFFENNKMGFITDSLQSVDFANAMRPYLTNKELYQEVSKYNHLYAMQHFLASKVAMNIEKQLKAI